MKTGSKRCVPEHSFSKYLTERVKKQALESVIFKTIYRLNLILLNKNYLMPTLTPALFFLFETRTKKQRENKKAESKRTKKVQNTSIAIDT